MSEAVEPPGLVVEGIEKTYRSRQQEVKAVKSVSFEVTPGGFFTLLGPSGCGKTTTMRCVAGLERPDAGRIEMSGQVISDTGMFVPTDKRPIGMVFQSYAIWPHMTVFENVAFPLRASKTRVSKQEMAKRVHEVLELVDLGEMGKRQATQMSGGQQQRLALARALVRRPKLLLLDEPLSNLDAKLRERLRREIRDLQKRLGITTLYVTHDQAEALSMSDSIAVMDSGVIAQLGTPREIYNRPRTRYVASFVGTINLLEATLTSAVGGQPVVDAGLGERGLLLGEDAEVRTTGEPMQVAVRPEALVMHHSDEAPLGANIFPGRIESAMFLGERLDALVRVGDQIMTVHSPASFELPPGRNVHVEIPPDACTVLADTSSPPVDEDEVPPSPTPSVDVGGSSIPVS